jgi:hypothetical protein
VTPPEGYYFVRDDVVEPVFGQCWEIALYENAKGEKWAQRWPITREMARNITSSPFWWRNMKKGQP